jgi:hypothetical protein
MNTQDIELNENHSELYCTHVGGGVYRLLEERNLKYMSFVKTVNITLDIGQ